MYFVQISLYLYYVQNIINKKKSAQKNLTDLEILVYNYAQSFTLSWITFSDGIKPQSSFLISTLQFCTKAQGKRDPGIHWKNKQMKQTTPTVTLHKIKASAGLSQHNFYYCLHCNFTSCHWFTELLRQSTEMETRVGLNVLHEQRYRKKHMAIRSKSAVSS